MEKRQNLIEIIYEKSNGKLTLTGIYTIDELQKIANGGKNAIRRDNNLYNKIWEQENLTLGDIPEF